ncbi:esterase [Arthrobacter sp. YAF34]|uniref:alpha/beta hydrolase n=1 Tax=Arthrobacter sp. YAF34 TaxID=3233083 RepID=UPI003F8E486C
MEAPGISRRSLLGLGAGAVAAAALAGCAGPGSSSPAPPIAPAAALRSGSFASRFRPQAPTGWSIAVPGPASSGPSAPLPVALFLHGAHADHRMIFDDLGAVQILAQHVAGGGKPFAIAAVDGRESWWHPRAAGTDTQSMLLQEFLPLLGRQGVDAGRSDNFDSAADFAANDIFALRPELKSLPKRIDCGTADNLLYSVTDYVKDLPGDHEGGFQAGGHDAGYWRSILPEVLSFLGSHLA